MCVGYIESATINLKEFKAHNTQEQIKQHIKKIGDNHAGKSVVLCVRLVPIPHVLPLITTLFSLCIFICPAHVITCVHMWPCHTFFIRVVCV